MGQRINNTIHQVKSLLMAELINPPKVWSHLIVSSHKVFPTTSLVEPRIHSDSLDRTVKVDDLVVLGCVQAIDNHLKMLLQ